MKNAQDLNSRYSTEELCARILERHRARIKVRKQQLVLANLSRIVTAFLRLSNRKGYHAMSLRELADESGLSMGALYTYFDSKEMLLVMVVGEVANTMSEVLASVPEETRQDPRAHMYWLIDTHIRLTETMQQWFVFVFMETKSFPRSVRQAAVDSETLAEQELAEIIERGNAAGVFDVEDPQLFAAMVKPLLQDWYVKRAKYRRRKVGIDRYIEQVTNVIERAACSKT
ncbi:TetR/AcrR family transcriptional regulator [Chelativorans sp. Marseille-P2723]|uniref:TetR/AcrR family transcriptional regulator n=1 Tax=Chelativorans sp. Marseille-P2723 TaxID=2709133 RepID=UPI001FED5D76|nr:TetR/AcrR family transcriptional regulator [Chelativorans sp. Marseille-P2723]